jgi:membrane dipeptidase
MIVDAHLDMAWNALAGRDYDRTAAEIRAADPAGKPRCMLSLPELRRGGVGIVFGTLYTGTRTYDADGTPVYEHPPAEDARRQLDVYLSWESAGKARIIRDRASLDAHLASWPDDRVPGIVVLVEGGDSITTPEDLPSWYDAGVRVVGPAWSATRYCGGTGRPGGLTAAGRELLAAMRELGIVLDASHLAEEAFWDAIGEGPGCIVASHSNARALVPGDRHLTDDMIGAIAGRGGVIGLNLYAGFLVEGWKPGTVVTLGHVRAHAEHVASIAGWGHVGIGSDLDGGLGADETPEELDTAADIERVGDAVPQDARAGVLGANWLRVLRDVLPG